MVPETCENVAPAVSPQLNVRFSGPLVTSALTEEVETPSAGNAPGLGVLTEIVSASRSIVIVSQTGVVVRFVMQPLMTADDPDVI